MPAGFQTWTDDGASQITDNDILFTLALKGTTAGATWTQEGNNSGYYDLTFSGYSLADVPMLALKGQGSWHTLQAHTPNSVTFRIFRVGGSGELTYYFFTRRRPPLNSSKCGLEIFNASGEVVYASDTLIAKPIGIFSGELFGSSSYSGKSISGRDLAHVPVKMGTYSFQTDTYGSLGSCTAPGGINGYSLTRQTGFQRSAISVSTGNISSSPRASQTTISNVFCSTSFIPNSSSNGGSLSYKSLILDVTYF